MKVTVIYNTDDGCNHGTVDTQSGIGLYDAIQSQVDRMVGTESTNLDEWKLISHAIVSQTRATTWDGIIKVLSGYDQALVLENQGSTLIIIVK